MKNNKSYSIVNSAWVSSDGSFGSNQILTFNEEALNEKQWEELNELPDHKRIQFVKDCLDSASKS